MNFRKCDIARQQAPLLQGGRTYMHLSNSFIVDTVEKEVGTEKISVNKIRVISKTLTIAAYYFETCSIQYMPVNGRGKRKYQNLYFRKKNYTYFSHKKDKNKTY